MKLKMPSGETKIVQKIKGGNLSSISKPQWLDVDGERYLFKRRVKNTFSDVGEVFVTQILDKISLPRDYYVPYIHVKTSYGKNGTICRNFLQNGEKIVMAFDVIYKNAMRKSELFMTKDEFDEKLADEMKWPYLSSVEGMLKEIEEYANNRNYEIDLDDTKQKLSALFVIDFFLCQYDRHANNYGFILNHKDKTIRVAPFFDNGFALDLDLKQKYIKERLLRPKTYNSKVVLKLAYTQTESESFENSRYFKNGGVFVADIVELYNNNPNCKSIIDKFMALDMQSEIKLCEETNNIILPEIYKTHMKQYYKSRYDAIEEFINKINKRLAKSKTTSRVSLNQSSANQPKKNKEKDLSF
ncbi:MAG: hypothetical protein IKT27_02730 [Clostridia bacterium]|nr:hypothetical protein [Clostridia bacterium]